MITAIDTNVLVDIFLADPSYGPSSMERLQDASELGQLLVCNIVYAELVHGFRNMSALDETLSEMGIPVSPISNDVAYNSGLRWSRYRQTGGSRNRILADSLIGTHGLHPANHFLTRDNGLYRTYFSDLTFS